MTYSKVDKYARTALAEYLGQKSQEDIRVDLSRETGEHTFRPFSLGGSKENVSFSKVIQNTLLKGDWLRLLGNAFMELGSLVSIEMMGLWNNRGHIVLLTIRGKVGVITIMGQSGIQGALTHRALG